MPETDFSHEIFDKYFESGRVLKITMKNKSVLEGVLVGFFHGDGGEPYIVQWDFVKEADFDGSIVTLQIPESKKRIIKQDDILKIDFKYKS